LLNNGEWRKKRMDSKVWWKNMHGEKGSHTFSFDMKKEYLLFRDYPFALTPEEKEIFDESEPFWADFFRWRVKYGKGN